MSEPPEPIDGDRSTVHASGACYRLYPVVSPYFLDGDQQCFRDKHSW